MTEEEWFSTTDPIAMVEYLRGSPVSEDTITWFKNKSQFDDKPRGIDRKFRLFNCSCCRTVWKHIPEECNRDAVVAVENYLEGDLSGAALRDAFVASSSVEWLEDGSGRRGEPGYWIVKYLGRGFYKMTAAASSLMIIVRVIYLADEQYGETSRHEFECSYYSGLGVFLQPFHWPKPMSSSAEIGCIALTQTLRDIFGNPFQPIMFEPAWLTPTVVAIATSLYQDRAFDRLPILADALEEAGCTNADLLLHCRQPGEHVRGCWAVDLVLGKE